MTYCLIGSIYNFSNFIFNKSCFYKCACILGCGCVDFFAHDVAVMTLMEGFSALTSSVKHYNTLFTKARLWTLINLLELRKDFFFVLQKMGKF